MNPLRACFSASLLWALAAFTACTPAPCEQVATWRNASSQACQDCQRETCAMAVMTLEQADMSCGSEFACAARCPAVSATSCGCYESCLATPLCHDAYYGLLGCAAQFCTEACK